MAEQDDSPRKRGRPPGTNPGGRPTDRPKGRAITLRPFQDQEDWLDGQGGKEYLLRLVDWHKANPVPLYDPKDLIA